MHSMIWALIAPVGLGLGLGQTQELEGYLARNARPALEALVEAAERHRVLVVGDVHPAPGPKRLIVDLVNELGRKGALGAVALEVPMTQQPAIREYLRSDPEGVGILRAHPLVLRPHWGLEDEFLRLYRAIWALNRGRAPEGRIEVLAIDAPRGPPMVTSRREVLSRYVNRDAIMELRVRRWREARPDDRILIFVGDLHTLKGVEASLELGGEFDRLVPLAERLRRRWPADVYSAFADAGPEGHEEGASRIYPIARRVLGDRRGGLAVLVSPEFGGPADPVNFDAAPGAAMVEILPKSYTLARTTDLYIYFGASDSRAPGSGPRSR